MKFMELTEKEFKDFEQNHIYGSFYQTINWGKLKKIYGWDYYLLGLKENNKVVGATLLLKKKVFKNISIMYAPRGYLLDYNNFKVLKTFSDNIKKFAKKNKAIFVKIDPYLLYRERDINGKVVKNGIDNSNIIKRLENLGYDHISFDKINLQPHYAFALDLKGKTKEEVFNNMEPTTRKMIRKNEKMGIYCKEISLKELKKFDTIMNDTSTRREFINRPYEYYKDMYKCFKNDIKVVVAEINLDDYIKNLKKEMNDNKKQITLKKKELKTKENININKTNNIINELENQNNSLNNRLNRGEELRKEKGKILLLGSIMFLLHNKEMLSLYGGAIGEYKDFMAAYSTNWYMISYAIENNYEKYNFYGISNFDNPEDKMYGLYDFKRGFGGHVEEYIGEFNLITSKFWYFVYEVLYNSIYLRIKKIKLKKS